MNIRWIMHKDDGSTLASGWNDSKVSFRKNWSDKITSLQLQKEDKKLCTLSSKGKKSLFWQEDDYLVLTGAVNATMIARKIFKSLDRDLWLVLSVDTIVGNVNLDVVGRKIGINGGRN